MESSNSLTLTFNACYNSCLAEETFSTGKKLLLIYRKQMTDFLNHIFKKLYPKQYDIINPLNKKTIYQNILDMFIAEDYVVSTYFGNASTMIINSDEYISLKETKDLAKLKKYIVQVFNSGNKVLKQLSIKDFLTPNITDLDYSYLTIEKNDELLLNTGKLYIVQCIKKNLDDLSYLMQVYLNTSAKR